MNAVQERKHSAQNAKGHHSERPYHPNNAKLKGNYLPEFGILLGTASSMYSWEEV